MVLWIKKDNHSGGWRIGCGLENLKIKITVTLSEAVIFFVLYLLYVASA